ncbi:MAG: hypothetical protein J1E07_10750 [Treponema sp.]|nr:hypothetical protein [Treponema sp.]
MKKIISGIAALALAASVFAVDFSANVQIKGDVAGFKFEDDKSTITLFGFDNTDQKDDDLLTVSFAGDNAGAYFRFYTKAASDVGLTVRGIKVWFQPIEWLKVSVGNVDAGLYTERVNWWKVPCGASLNDFNSWNGRWASGAVLHEGFGALVELTPIDGLWVAAGVSSGAGNNWFTKQSDVDAVITQYGVGAKYQIVDIVSAGVAFRDTGTGNWKLLTVGADFGNWGTPYYAFLQGKLRFEKGSDWKLGGVTIDNYLSYNFGFMKLEGTIPVTIRLSGDDWDPSYMTARIKATIPLDALSLYFVVGSDEGLNNGPVSSVGKTVWTLNDKFGDNLNIYANVGLNFNVGSANLDCGVEFAYDKAAKTTVIAVPFVAKVAF